MKRAIILIDRNLKMRKKNRPNTNIFPIPISAKPTAFIDALGLVLVTAPGLRSLNI
jgi:hypothetical protein